MQKRKENSARLKYREKWFTEIRLRMRYHDTAVMTSTDSSPCYSYLQGALAKKPYNPILGETFSCSWDVREACSTGVERNPLNTANDVSASEDDRTVRFFAEQVSHHPPGQQCSGLARHILPQDHQCYYNHRFDICTCCFSIECMVKSQQWCACPKMVKLLNGNFVLDFYVDKKLFSESFRTVRPFQPSGQVNFSLPSSPLSFRVPSLPFPSLPFSLPSFFILSYYSVWFLRRVSKQENMF